MPDKKHKFDEEVENKVASIVIDQEYAIAKGSRSAEMSDLESLVDMLECKRTEKNYDWMSDIFLPEFPAAMLTDASNWASQYFQTREFIEVKLDGEGPDDDKKCKAAKLCINQTLSRRDLYHYHKYIRGRTINSMSGMVYGICWWEQEIRPKQIGVEEQVENLDVDVYGNEITSPEQVPATRINEIPVYAPDIIKDHFQYDIIDPRNVFTNKKYCYSIQEKDWVTVRSETSYEELRANEKKVGYFNLDLVKELAAPSQTDTAKETFEKNEDPGEGDKPVSSKLDKLIRFGKMWVKVKERSEDGYPKVVMPAWDNTGELPEDAELIDTLIEYVLCGNSRVLVRFQPNPFRDTHGNSYYPMVRGWCYIHPTKDSGLSDGNMLREIQIGINDMFNMGMDRSKLATMPTLKGKKHSLEDNTTIYFKPEHVMELENPDDLQEFKISDDITGATNVIAMLQGEGQKAVAIFPTTMGSLPDQASQTATAVAGAESRGNIRGNYKSLTFEYTFLLEFYWIILQMTHMFMRPETAQKMMGKYAEFFDPDSDYTYSPVSANIETEYNKNMKLKIIDQFIGRLAQVPNPNTPKVINYLLGMAFEAFGKEFPDYKKYMMDESVPPPMPAGAGGAGVPGMGAAPPTQMPTQPMGAPSNQAGMPMSPQEENTRMMMGE
jgi:hypothetical protein